MFDDGMWVWARAEQMAILGECPGGVPEGLIDECVSKMTTHAADHPSDDKDAK
jgi:hypothetical protein